MTVDQDVRKKGVRRFFEILARNFWGLVKLNLLYCLCVFPSAALFLAGLFGVLSGFVILLVIPATFPVGGALSASSFCITKMLRDDPGYIWYDFKRKFLENMKQAMLPGMLYASFIYAQIYLWGSWLASGAGAYGIGWFILGLTSLLIVGMISPYFFLQIAYIDIRTPQIIKNAMLLSFGAAARSLAGVLTGGLVWAMFFLFLPDSLIFAPLFLFIGFSISRLLNMFWVWQPVDKQFSIEETLSERF